MADPDPQLADLTREKNLWEVRKTVATLPQRWAYRYWAFEFGLAAISSAYLFASKVKPKVATDLIAKLMEQGFSIAVQILSFSLAGLAIYAAALASDLARPLLEFQYPGTNMSTLKVNGLAYVRVFFACLLMVFAYFGWTIFFADGGLLPQFFQFLVRDGRPWDFALAFGAGVATLLVTHLLVTVQLFLFDLHHTVMSFARGKVMLDKARARQDVERSTRN